MAASWTGVSRTCLLTAALRAAETGRADRLFCDPHAEALAGPEGRALLDEVRQFYARNTGVPSTASYNAIRTRFFDEHLLAAAGGGSAQIVIAAAGMDSRAWRLDWPAGVRLFEIDYGDVLANKHRVLAVRGASPRCEYHPVSADLRDAGWPAQLLAAGYRPERPAAWLLEGLLYYLTAPAVHALLSRVAGVVAPGVTLAADLVDDRVFEMPLLRPMFALYEAWGAPWLFGTEDPAQLWLDHGFTADVIRPGDPGADYGRWTDADRAASAVIRLFFVRGAFGGAAASRG